MAIEVTECSPAEKPVGLFARHLFLIGFMGAGKSTVARILARRLGLPAIDLDREIEGEAGSSIARIFAEQGEEAFRRHESRALARICASAPAVVATGGGAPLSENNRSQMRQAGVTVWLNPEFSTLVARLDAAERRARPLFEDEAAAEALWRGRLPVYRLSDMEIVVGPESTPAEVAREVIGKLSQEGCECVI